MKTLSRFVSKFTRSIVAVLACFDRVIFKGHLALAAPCELEYVADRVLKVRRSDFMKTLAPRILARQNAGTHWSSTTSGTQICMPVPPAA